MSTVSAVIAALKTTIDGAVSVEVMDGAPTDQGQRDYVAIGDVIQGLQEYRLLANTAKPRNETYEVMVEFVAVRPGPEQTEARTAATTLWSASAAAVATDPKLGIGATYPALFVEPGPFDIKTDLSGSSSGYRSTVLARFRVQTRLK